MNNLPLQSTTFIGRSRELTEIAALLAAHACRLLTICGVGGIGKTRLALQVAADQLPNFAHGVYFISLAPLTSPDQIAAAIAAALDMPLMTSESVQVQLIRILRDKQVLLVLDNFEHLLDGVPLLSEILRAEPAVKLLVTSRERLNIQEEWAFPLDGLSFPGTTSTEPLVGFSAVQLFVQRAKQAQPHFSLSENAHAVASICRMVEGMPLALELAGGWLRAMSCAQVAAQLSSSLDLLTTPYRNAPERHRSLRAVFEQSWEMLSPPEKQVMARLSVFRGGFDHEAAAQVAGASLPLLVGLVDKSLIRMNADGRYDLHELLRQFATESLSPDETLATLQSHFDYFLALAQQVEAHQFGRELVAWFDRAETELDNFRLAFEWSLQNRDAESVVRLAISLGWFLSERTHWREGAAWFDRLLPSLAGLPLALHADALSRAGSIANHLNHPAKAEIFCRQALALARKSGNRASIAWALAHLGFMPANPSRQMLGESLALFRELDDPMGMTHVLVRQAWISCNNRNFLPARPLLEQALTIANRAGDPIMLGWIFRFFALIEWDAHRNLAQAREYAASSLAYFQQARFYNGIGRVLLFQAHVERVTGNLDAAQAKYEEALHQIQVRLPSNYHFNMSLVLAGLANIARSHGHFRRSATLLGAVSAFGWIIESDPEWNSFEADAAAVRAHLGDTAFENAMAAGQAMTRDDIIAYARTPEPAENPATHPTSQVSLPNPLTPRELEILALLAAGHTNRIIAEKLVLSPVTVKWYVSEILSKLNVSNRTQAVAQAQKLRLLTPEN